MKQLKVIHSRGVAISPVDLNGILPNLLDVFGPNVRLNLPALNDPFTRNLVHTLGTRAIEP